MACSINAKVRALAPTTIEIYTCWEPAKQGGDHIFFIDYDSCLICAAFNKSFIIVSNNIFASFQTIGV